MAKSVMASSTRGTGKKSSRGTGGRKKTLHDLGVRRVPSARELFARELRAELPVYTKRRVREKRSFWSLLTLHAKFRALPPAHMAMWVARAEKAKEDRRTMLRERPTPAPAGDCDDAAAERPPSPPPAEIQGTTQWLRLDCSAEPPVDASEVLEMSAAVPAGDYRLEWVDDLGCDRRSLRRLPEALGELGRGSYGCCYIYEDEDSGEHVCAKLQKAADDQVGEAALRNELRVMIACNHPNVMRGFAVVRCLGIGRSALLMPKCVADLHVWLQTTLASVVMEHDQIAVTRMCSGILLQACRGYAHLHGAGYLHLDIKPENVVVQSATGVEGVRVCIADFGISRSWSPCKSSLTSYAPASSIQSEPYRPWDLHHAAHGKVPLRPRHDIWAFGCLVYDVCSAHSRQRGKHGFGGRLFTGIPMRASYDSVMSSRNYRLGAHLTAREAALVVRSQDLKDPRRNHVRMEEFLPSCRAVATV